MPPRYRATISGIQHWAEGELAHVGRIASIEDPDIQYAYAQSTVNGMLHLHDAIAELVSDPKYNHSHEELTRLQEQVTRVVKHLIAEYNVNVENIKSFNTHQVLGNLSYLNSSSKPNNRFAISNNNNNNTRSNSTNPTAVVGGTRRRTRKAVRRSRK